MKKTLLLFLAILNFSVIIAQDTDGKDPKAKAILDKVSKQAQNYNTAYIEFDYTMVNQDAGINDTQHGKIWFDNVNFKLELNGQEIISDGTTQYTIIDEIEVQIDNAPTAGEGEEGITNPKELFTMHEKDFKYKYEGQITKEGKTYDLIKLFPEKPGKAYSMVVLMIEAGTGNLHSVTMMQKDGTNYIYTIKKIDTNITIEPSTFTVDTSQYDVIDLRE